MKPSSSNQRFGVERMEMLAIYFALADNRRHIERMAALQGKDMRMLVQVRSDSKTSVEQLHGLSEIRDAIIQRICMAIKVLLDRTPIAITFHYLERTRNIAGLLLEQRKRKQMEELLLYQDQRHYCVNVMRGFAANLYGLAPA
ncbi:MAG: hypothetical protein ACREAZ_01745 [Nitrososphaera sp.]